jgi:hypothetical protein
MTRIVWLFLGIPILCVAAYAQTPNCDKTLNAHVYHPDRLIVKNQCIAVMGTIVDATNAKRSDGLRHEADGDNHGWLDVDPQFRKLLNTGNLTDEGGNLVFEVICIYPVRQDDAKSSCKNFRNRVAIPPVGTRVKITGRYVQDTYHAKWMEIHPVTSIEVLSAAGPSRGNDAIKSRSRTTTTAGKQTERPSGATARCKDGTYSFSTSRTGTCSHHGGVAEWF